MSLSVADILARKHSLTPEQRAQLERRLRGEATPSSGPEPIRPAARAPRPPLSFAQQRLWFLDQMEPGNPFYNVPRALRFEGRLDPRALRESFTEIVRRHESLRTAFPAADGEPFQHTHAPRAVEVPLVDLSGLDAAAREAEARRVAEGEAAWRFDLGAGPLMRVVLVRLAPGEQVLLLNMHHIVTDGWSMQVLVKELTALYDAYSRGEESPLAEPSIQYADFSAWQAGQLRGERLEQLLEYWRGRLAGAPTTLELPTDRPRPAVQSHRGGTLSFFVEGEVADALARLSQAEGATLFMTLLAAFQTLLHRHTGLSDIIVGSPIANRGRAELEGLIGFFVNTLALRATFERGETFRGLLRRTRETTLEAYAHQDLPFERLVEELQPERDLSRTPLFQVMFVFQNVPGGGGEAGVAGPRLASQEVYATTAKFELTLTVTQTGRGLSGSFEYNSDLFDRATVERMAAHLRVLLAAAAADPDARVSELPLMTDEERALVLKDWNAAARARDGRNCAHHMFERQAALTPGRTALVFEGEALSYTELDVRANRLARHLRRLGVGPESRVAISLERSTAMVLAVLGALKAGACYVPIDPSYPLERRSVMLGASGAQVLLTRRGLSGELDAGGTRVLCWEDLEEAFGRESGAGLAVEVAGANLAYVIYTSGSTGGPKGVALTHAALANLIEWHRDTLLPGARTLQFASLSFDVSFHEMFAAWATGGTLYLIAEFERMDVAALCDFIDRHRIEKVILPVVVLQEMGAQKGEAAGTLTSLREIMSTGEQLKLTAAVVGMFKRLEGCALHNHYGPAESHAVTAYTFEGEPETWPALPPIGRPIYNTRIYVLDEQLNPVPVGVHGELYIGGECLARGYLNRPATTAERFVPDPFGRHGERLYRTGDVARYLADGQLEFLGRKDEQVKLRGFRVEPGEIEAALSQHPVVAEAAVCAVADPTGGMRLIAYVVPDRAAGAPAPTALELRAHLKERLPEYMIPAAFVALDALPLTPNGKLDRRALPDPGDPHEGLGREYVAPSGEIESALAAVWEQVLGATRVGAHDNFFELGGHSLKATQVLSRIRGRFGDAVTLRDLFSTPTLRELAETIAAREVESGAAAGNDDEIERVGEKEFYATSSAQRRVWVVCQEPSASRAYNIPGTFLLEGELDAAALGRAFRGLVQRHESLRTTFALVGGELKQRIGDGVGVEVETLDLGLKDDGSELPAAFVREAALREADQLFDLERGPLVRAKLAKVGPDKRLFLLTLHHIIADGWSLSLLGRELVWLYDAAREGRDDSLGELRIQYRDYAEWESGRLAGERLEAQARYWRGKLAGELTPTDIGGDFEGAAGDRYRGEVCTITLDEELTESLRALGRENGASLYMILLAAVYVLLHRYTGQEDIVVACPVSGRGRRELEAVVGMFLNTLLLRTEVRGDDSLGRLLGKVRATTLEAFEHQDYPFDLLARELRVERPPGRPPLMEVVVTLQEEAGDGGARPAATEQGGGLRVSEWGQWNGVSKNDLWFGFKEDGRGLSGALNYDSDKFAAETVEGLVARLKEILARMAEGPGALVSELLAGAAARPAEESFGFDVAL
ncbi:MAG TPA: amino acid adenylation domain-containing protein [Pyrinomonadaceae bacterium]